MDVCDLIEKHYVKEVKTPDLVTGAINGMLHELDPYSEYIPGKEVAEFEKQTSGSYEGIGVVIDVQQGYITVVSPFEDSPAYKAGMMPGDIILEVSGQSTKGWSATRAVKELTGPAGSEVVLKILHADGSEETLTLRREKINVPMLKGWRRIAPDGQWDYWIDAENKIGYVRLTQFTQDSGEKLDEIVQTLLKDNMKAMILDLRSNPGGLMSAAIEIVDRFLDQGVIISTQGAHSPRQVQNAKAEGTWPRFHTVILINQGSASASEIVSGSLQDNNRAVIVGKRSWGKGSVQRLIRLPQSDATLKLTTDYYYLPKGRCLHRLPNSDIWGVDPDIEQDLDPESLTRLRDLIQKLTMYPPKESAAKPADAESNSDPAPTEEEKQKKQAQDLFELDLQLDQAVKQCKGLIRTRPALQSITETFSD